MELKTETRVICRLISPRVPWAKPDTATSGWRLPWHGQDRVLMASHGPNQLIHPEKECLGLMSAEE